MGAKQQRPTVGLSLWHRPDSVIMTLQYIGAGIQRGNPKSGTGLARC